MKIYDYQWNCPFNKLIKKYPLVKNDIEKVRSNVDNPAVMLSLNRKNECCSYELMDAIFHLVSDKLLYVSQITNIDLNWMNPKLSLSYMYNNLSENYVINYTFKSRSLLLPEFESLNLSEYALAFNWKIKSIKPLSILCDIKIYFEDVEQMIKYKLMHMDVA